MTAPSHDYVLMVSCCLKSKYSKTAVLQTHLGSCLDKEVSGPGEDNCIIQM